MRFETMEITPAKAAEFLRGNDQNRAIRKARVEFLAGALLRGEWKTTHQGIAISPGGRLLDGQHRLMAIVTSGVPAQMVVAFDAPEETFDAVDLHEKRGLHDALRISKDEAAVARMVFSMVVSGTLVCVPTTSQAQQVWNAITPFYEILWRGCSLRVKARSSTPMRVAVLGHIISGNGDQAVRDYAAFVSLDIGSMSPATGSLLRQLEDRNIKVRSGGAEMLAKAWVAFSPRKRDVTKVTLKDVGKHMEEIQNVFRGIIRPESLE